MEHKRVMDLIKAVRGSFLEAGIVYTMGACYGFYQILKAFDPKAKAYIELPDKQHIVTKINGKYYDIKGECLNRYLEQKGEFDLLTAKEHEYWEGVIINQPMHYILRKED